MTTACKCDRCDELFCFAPGDVRVEFHVTESVDKQGAPTQQGFEVDLCHKCSAVFLEFIRHNEDGS